jgi:hypothetical protein
MSFWTVRIGVLILLLSSCEAWSRWRYEGKDFEGNDQIREPLIDFNGFRQTYKEIWEVSGPIDIDMDAFPRARRGHSLTWIRHMNGDKNDGDYIFLFGGRGNDAQKEHVPKTYNVEKVDGQISFTTYTEKPVSPCDDPENIYWSKESQAGCSSETSSGIIDVGKIYNDVWMYRVNCLRSWESPCRDRGWILWHPGAQQGGCGIQLGIEVCTTPSERWNHGTATFGDGTVYVYGGFSQRCADYCEDIWMFDLYMKGWLEVYSAGELSKLYILQPDNTIVPYPRVPIDDANPPNAGPGKRWRHSMAVEDGNIPWEERDEMAIFGGHRIWHGLSVENDQWNDWGNNNTIPYGGFLSDLWVYRKTLDRVTTNGQSFKTADTGGMTWRYYHPKQKCVPAPVTDWDSRGKQICYYVWPGARAGHASIFDRTHNRIWIYGGYVTHYPYLETDGEGSGPGVQALSTGGFVPYPTYDYYLDDLWYFDLTTEEWTHVEYNQSEPYPSGRVDMALILKNDTLVMHGGFGDNIISDEFWLFNISTSRWLEKTTFIYPKYPPGCTEDFEYINALNCTKLQYPNPLKRAKSGTYDILPWEEQPYYMPDSSVAPQGYWGIRPRGFVYKNESLIPASALADAAALISSTNAGDYGRTYESTAAASVDLSAVAEQNEDFYQAQHGTPMFPYAASGPLQYAQPVQYRKQDNSYVTIYEHCTSVFLETTRGEVLDGIAGRSTDPIFIAIPRRQRPDWDGCRDNIKSSASQGLAYQKPTARYGHRMVYIESYNELWLYGGMAHSEEQNPQKNITWPAKVNNEFWRFSFDHCINNCSLHGDCVNGFCHCWNGYYGEDCSNISCPGTECWYDGHSHRQVCKHACQAAYEHKDNDKYVQDIAKVPCSEDLWNQGLGWEHGKCDGWGHSMCAAPFVGEDCSTKDCKYNCSFNGWCAIEFPVGRCICNPGYFGEYCEFQDCLNNCSYPNGQCNMTSGVCLCERMYNPYISTRVYHTKGGGIGGRSPVRWAGEDCSYLMPYAAAARGTGGSAHSAFFLLLAICVAVVSVCWADGLDGDRTSTPSRSRHKMSQMREMSHLSVEQSNPQTQAARILS